MLTGVQKAFGQVGRGFVSLLQTFFSDIFLRIIYFGNRFNSK
jgi:hypothetical protein